MPSVIQTTLGIKVCVKRVKASEDRQDIKKDGVVICYRRGGQAGIHFKCNTQESVRGAGRWVVFVVSLCRRQHFHSAVLLKCEMRDSRKERHTARDQEVFQNETGRKRV